MPKVPETLLRCPRCEREQRVAGLAWMSQKKQAELKHCTTCPEPHPRMRTVKVAMVEVSD